ncbi:MAG: enoyl-CoA hydratase-related protein [Acidimicrobiia bacterium]
MAVRFELDDRVAIVTIDRPEARNAVSPEVAADIEAAVDRIEEDPEIWCWILTGVPPAFSAGADLAAIAQGRMAELRTARGGFGGVVRRERTKPLIAAVEGAAFGGGFEMVLAADLVVAAEGARFGLPEVRRGILAGGGGVVRLPTVVPRNLALELALTGEPISAAVAQGHGLVNRVVPDGEALAEAKALAALVCAAAPLAVRASRAAILATTEQGVARGWVVSAQGQEDLQATEDAREGPRAFLEKRPPRWLGR